MFTIMILVLYVQLRNNRKLESQNRELLDSRSGQEFRPSDRPLSSNGLRTINETKKPSPEYTKESILKDCQIAEAREPERQLMLWVFEMERTSILYEDFTDFTAYEFITELTPLDSNHPDHIKDNILCCCDGCEKIINESMKPNMPKYEQDMADGLIGYLQYCHLMDYLQN